MGLVDLARLVYKMFVNRTVNPEIVAYLAGSKLLVTTRDKLIEASRVNDIVLIQTFERESKFRPDRSTLNAYQTLLACAKAG